MGEECELSLLSLAAVQTIIFPAVTANNAEQGELLDAYLAHMTQRMGRSGRKSIWRAYCRLTHTEQSARG